MTIVNVNKVNRLNDKVLSLESDSLFKGNKCYEINETKIISILSPHFEKNSISVSIKDGNLKVSFYAENHVYFGYVDESVLIPVGDVKVFDYFIIDSVLQIILKAN